MNEKPWVTGSGVLRLVLGRCIVCQHTFFPPQLYGCESCGSGAESLTTLTVPAAGTLTAAVTVGAHPVLATPFTVGDIVLDQQSVVVQALLATSLSAGDRVVGQLETDQSGELVVFAAERESA